MSDHPDASPETPATEPDGQASAGDVSGVKKTSAKKARPPRPTFKRRDDAKNVDDSTSSSKDVAADDGEPDAASDGASATEVATDGDASTDAAGTEVASDDDPGDHDPGNGDLGDGDLGDGDLGDGDLGDGDLGDGAEDDTAPQPSIADDLEDAAAKAPDGDADEEPGSEAKPIMVRLFGRTDVGQIREHNEDNFLIANLSKNARGIAKATQTVELDTGGLLLAVCDGMGGAAAGEVASQLATDIVYDHMSRNAGHADRDRLALNIVQSLEEAGARILDESESNRACRGMGTTATVAALVDDHLLLGQVGDSRAYILRGNRLVQVTRDQSLVTQLIEAGQLTEEEAENFEHSNIILQALGTADAVQVDLTYVRLCRGDVLMMCSDGLSGMVRDGEVRETLTNVPDPVDACRVLIDEANQAGGHDNITVITAVFDGEGLREPNSDDVESLKYTKYALPTWVSEHPSSQANGAGDEVDTYDDTPSIEIIGEFEIDPDMDWDDLIQERVSIPTKAGPNISNVVIWVALIGIVVVGYYLATR